MTYVAESFNRPDGALSPNWSSYFPFSDVNADVSAGGIQVLSKAFASLSATGNGAYACWKNGWGVTSFANNQWAKASIAAIAPSTSVVAITACVSSGGTSTYTYTLTTGAALLVNQELYIAGMKNAGNNSPVGGSQITALGSGTFSIANASPGANESGSAGTGNSPSDSVCGVAVRCTADGQNGYVIQVGTNSSTAGNNGGAASDSRVYCVELWKLVAGVSSYLAGYFEGLLTTIPDKVGDFYTLSAVGTTISVYKNGLQLIQVTDTSLASGMPGIGTWSVGGAGEWTNPTIYATGNSSTQWTNFSAGDYAAATLPYFDDYLGANDIDLHSYNANWVENSGTFNIKNVGGAFGVLAATYVGGNALASWQGASFSADQWAQLTMFTVTSGQGIGPAARVAASGNSGYFYRPASATTRVLYKINAGSYTLLGTSNTSHANAIGDVLRIAVIGSSIRCYINGALESFGAITDATLASGFPGIEGTTTTIGACFECGNCAISGNAGIASASLALTGASSASATADANGNYLFPSLADGSYTITPTLAGQAFSPTSLTVALVGGAIFPTGENFISSTAGNAYDSTKPFIGSVRVLGSAPAGEVNDFIGTMRVIASPPAGEANPYLGSVTVGTPSSGDSNPALGQVVIVSSIPAGATDEYLGQIEES
jgi:hypothetical protein